MKLLPTLALCVSLLGSATATPGLDNETELFSRAGPTFPIRGIHEHGIHPRLEIRTMQTQHPYMFNLFLLAMADLKSKPQDHKLSYYQISGIHGVPNIPWDGVRRNPHEHGAVGYCTHNSILFPAWHRPYVALFEQALYRSSKEVASRFKGAKRRKYMAIAKTMRLPYWDWAIAPPKGGQNMPISIVAPTVNLDTPHGRKTIVNPLHSYNFHPFHSGQFLEQPWDRWHHTLRQPSSGAPNAHTQTGKVVRTAGKARGNLKALVYYMMTHSSTWANFASAGTNGYNSIEAIHNIVHGMIGGGGTNKAGHMTVLWYSAFDPVFWLHHSNVDRLIAMWQKTHPNLWVQPQRASQSTYTIAKGSIQGPNSHLTPFHKDSHGHFWTSNGVRDWHKFGYTYPVFQGGATAGQVRAVINRNYGPHSKGHAAKRDDFFGDFSEDSLLPPLDSLTTPNGSYYQYITNIATGHNGLNGSYGVYIFLGDPPTDVSEWETAPNLVGSNFVFAAPDAAEMGSQLVTGSVPLTDALTGQVGLGALENLAVELVVPFLQNLLQWHVAQDGIEVDPSQVPGLQVSVVSAELTPPATEFDFPIWGPETVLMNVTHGKSGGLSLGSVIDGLQNLGDEIAGVVGGGDGDGGGEGGIGELGQEVSDGIGGLLGG